ncbi:fimbrial protein [Pseudomonas cedrina]|uniref:fimbrial protein n=1 Tax=Pseudomonas cedrina TaxID=651740 RepID=UPI0027857860|nr:fimbrial protein [Pseudomonas cedrina]MDQ0651167.1 major type 1 subunit fimbrin (pilin) [Pseudomonas cedrina]
MNIQTLPLILAVSAAIATGPVNAATTGSLGFAGQVDGGTCNLAAGDVSRTITLPTVKVSDFDSSTNVGQTPFQVTAECESDIRNVTFLFTGTADSDNGLLFNNTGSATGLGVWLRAGATATTIPANGTELERSRTVATTASKAVLDASAAYHKNNAAVGRGTLVSAVTLSITYD